MNEYTIITQTPSESNRRDRDGLHKRRGVWHYKLKIAGRWRETSTRTTNYREARKIRQQALQAQEEGRLPNDLAKWPFEKAASQWLDGRTKFVAPTTYRIDKERLVQLLKVFRGRRLCDITAAEINGYQVLRAIQTATQQGMIHPPRQSLGGQLGESLLRPLISRVSASTTCATIALRSWLKRVYPREP